MSDERQFQGVTLSGTVARGVRTPLFEEPEDDGVKKPRTRISARYSLDRWAPEREREREIEAPPPRSESHQGITPVVGATKAPKQPKFARRYTHEELSAVTRCGAYELVKVFATATDSQRGGTFKVSARCMGGHCGGRFRNFDAGDWTSGKNGQACGLCRSVQDRADARARQMEQTKPTHGLYVFIEHCPRYRPGHTQKGYGALGVRARCTGPWCGAKHERVFAWSIWMDSEEGINGCRQCGTPRGEKSGTAKLTPEQISLIRARYASAKGEWGTAGALRRSMAAEYGVTERTIENVVYEANWKSEVAA